MKRLFIANRGEILRRIATTARELGIETAAFTDRPVCPAYLHGLIDYFVRVEVESTPLYLDMQKVIAAAKQAGADAIHPGFGFLSENAEFARAVLDAGMIWVGPNPEAIMAMASKSTARTYALNSGVPCVPGLQGFVTPKSVDGDFSVLEKFAADTPYPLLVKAAYGGGGKGMRLVHRKEELRSAAVRASSEAAAAFGNGELIVERYLGEPRHVEVQILADRQGNVYAIGDRDCSVQRRHQKIVEEAPAPNLPSKTRERMHQAAISLAKKVGYDSTGTVEFLVDWSADGQARTEPEFFFLEMNTRLQVEHPVTEEVFGLDLVAWQLRVASGEKLPQSFANLEPRGHSIECRIYAEDVAQGYLPSAGKMDAFKMGTGPGVRWEVGLDTIDEVTSAFDPMIAKLVVTGATREAACARAQQVLARTLIVGPQTNQSLLMDILQHEVFVKQSVSTHYLEQNIDYLLSCDKNHRQAVEELGMACLKAVREQGVGGGQQVRTHSAEDITQRAFGIKAVAASPRGRIRLGSPESHRGLGQEVIGIQIGSGEIVDSEKSCSFWYAVAKAIDKTKFWVSLGGRVFAEESKRDSWQGEASGRHHDGSITAPVPGKVVRVMVKAGSEVDSGIVAFVLESMKMEFEVKTTRGGKLHAINVQEGQQVAGGQQLATWEDE
jgi:acetyl/propionyl-CoA carboxylase alpha subunit